MRSGTIAFFLLTLCILALPARAQSTEAELKSRLIGKPLYLRGCWRDDKLHFDSTGKLKGNSDPVTFTLSGFDLYTLHLKRDMLVLEGHRIGLELRDNKQRRVPLKIVKLDDLEDEPIKIEIEANPSGDYGPPLDAIFANGLAELVPSMPFYWKSYAIKNFLPVDQSSAPATSTASNSIRQGTGSPETKAQQIGGEVIAPKLLTSKEPQFNNSARILRYSGNVLINLWVRPDGTVSHLSLIRPLGLGLDESALIAVQKYTFSPAMQNDKPVLVEVNIEVNFQILR